MAIEEALEMVRKQGDLPVPLHIRNAPTRLMKNMGYGKNYKYAHSYEQNFTEQEFLPDEISGTAFYDPGKNPREEELRKLLRSLWKNKYNY
jgi:putative ATPase